MSCWKRAETCGIMSIVGKSIYVNKCKKNGLKEINSKRLKQKALKKTMRKDKE